MPDALVHPWHVTEIGGDAANPKRYVVPEAHLRELGWVPVAERDKARNERDQLHFALSQTLDALETQAKTIADLGAFARAINAKVQVGPSAEGDQGGTNA